MASSVRKALSFRLFPLVIMGIVILYLGASFARQASISHQRREELRELEAEIAATERENVDLQERFEYVQSPEAAEEWARQNGWAQQDEVSVVVVAPSADSSPSDTRGTTEEPKPSSNREVWWDLFFGER
jgi:cell division protein FtsB